MKFNNSAIALALTFVSGLSLSAQTATKKNSTDSAAKYEINLFGGGNFYNRQNIQPHQDMSNGGVGGFRFTQNFWEYISLEQTGMVHGVANAVYRIPGTEREYSFGARLRQFHVNPVFHFKPRQSRIRPFVTAGYGLDYFGVTEDARRQIGNGVNTPFQQLTNLESGFKLAFNYGAGVKAKLTERIGLRFDVRGFSTASPSFGVKGAGLPSAITYTRTTPVSSVQTTGGVVLYLGAIDQGPVCEFRPGSIEPSTKTIWLTEGATFQLPVSNTCLGVTPKYKWTVDGQPAVGDSMLAVKGLTAADHQIKAIVEADTTKATDRKTRNFLKKFPIPAAERSATLTVKQPKIELVSVTMDPATLSFRGSSQITSVISYDGPAEGEEVTVVYTATDGTLAPTKPGPNTKVSADGKTVEDKVLLKPGNTTGSVILSTDGILLQPGGPSRRIEVNVTVRDKNGKVITSKSPPGGGATVMAPPAPAAPPAAAPPRPQPMQLDDVVFGKGAARVNNCGKRILDQAYERAASMGDFDVLLVGHYDAVEKNIKVRDAKAKKTRLLDEERVLQVAAVLSGGTEPCKRLDRNRIKVAMVGAEQLSSFKTSLCEATVKERATGKINAKDGNARNRRVEIWLVPKGGPMPNGIAGIQDAPAAEIQSKGCPK